MSTMKIFIDDRQAETGPQTLVALTLGPERPGTPDEEASDTRVEFTLPLTAANAALICVPHDMYTLRRFNDSVHPCRVELNGTTVLEGVAELVECVDDMQGNGCYKMVFHVPPRSWAVYACQKRLPELFPQFSVELGEHSVESSWTSDSPVKFLPVLREDAGFDPDQGEPRAERVLTTEDFHPFVNVKAMMEEIFAGAGYTLESDFARSTSFRTLYMSGNYSRDDLSPVRERMDFRAGRYGEASAQADYLGRVYADPYSNYSTVGNLVDTADPAEERNGVKLPWVFSNGGCFRKVDERVAFVPLSEVYCGFRYRMKLRTGYRIKDSSTLTGFDTCHLGGGQTVRYGLPNRFADRREQFRSHKDFLCVVPGHRQGYRYRLEARLITNPAADPKNLRPGDYRSVTVGEFSARSATVSTRESGTYGDAVLYYGTGSAADRLYTGEWMLYDGYVGETGVTEVEVTLTGLPEVVSPSVPKFFDTLFWSGAEERMELTVVECEVTPVFHPHPATGSTVGFSDIMAHDESQMALVSALSHMFDLRFVTYEAEKRVRMESARDFCNGPVLDWSDRIDYSKPVAVVETGTGEGRTKTWCYRRGDGAADRLEEESGERLGAWSVAGSNVFARGEQIFENPLFTPSVNNRGCLAGAMSASLVNVGPRGKGSGELNFPPKIVRYVGMVPLESGEEWPWPSAGTNYPLLAFHLPDIEGGFTLCFGDRDGQHGLHMLRDWSGIAGHGICRLKVWMRLGETDVEQLLVPGRLKHDRRARFLLRIGGEQSTWRLEQVCGYHPGQESTQCVFVKSDS